MTTDPAITDGTGDNALITVILEPLPDRTDDEVTHWLAGMQAKAVQVVAPRFISAAVSAQCLEAAKRLATVTIKTRKQPRHPR